MLYHVIHLFLLVLYNKDFYNAILFCDKVRKKLYTNIHCWPSCTFFTTFLIGKQRRDAHCQSRFLTVYKKGYLPQRQVTLCTILKTQILQILFYLCILLLSIHLHVSLQLQVFHPGNTLPVFLLMYWHPHAH